MSKLPNADQAIIPIEKFTLYALNPDHLEGQHKARVFKSALGITLDDAQWLRERVREAAQTEEATPTEPTDYGQRFVVDFELTTDSGTATIRTAWIVRTGEDIPRLTTLYVMKDET